MRAALALLALAAACSPPEEGPLMRPGESCLRCHAPGGEDPDAPAWTLAGTVYRDPFARADKGLFGAQVRVTDAAGKVVELRTGGTGNFYTAEPLAFPVSVEVSGGGASAVMRNATGDCNACHGAPPREGAPGRIYLRK